VNHWAIDFINQIGKKNGKLTKLTTKSVTVIPAPAASMDSEKVCKIYNQNTFLR